MIITTAMAYGPDKPSIVPGVRTVTDSEVAILGDLDVNDDQLVEVVTLPGGRGDWSEPGQVLRVKRVQLGHIRRSGYGRAATLAAKLAMSTLASRMHPAGGPLRTSDPVAYWDLRTSMDDQRAALCLGAGLTIEQVSRDGYNISQPNARESIRLGRESHGARS